MKPEAGRSLVQKALDGDRTGVDDREPPLWKNQC